MKTINISKGINLRLIDGEKFGYVTASILFRQPIHKDKATANSLLSLMLLSGSSRYKNRRLIEIAFEELEGALIDASIIKKGSEHIVQIYTKFKEEYTNNIFEILQDIIFKPLFKNEYIEKEILKNIIKSQVNNKRQYAFNSFLEKNYGDINGDGYTEDVDKIDIHKEYKSFIDNSIIEIMVVGGNPQNITDAVKTHINFSPRLINSIPLKKLRPIRSEYTEESDVIQAKLCVGIDCDFVCKGIDYAKLMVANDIFGSGASSRLFMEAREKNSLCYYITSRLFRFSSFMAVEAGIDADNKDKTVEIIKKAIDFMQKKEPDKEVTELSKTSIINNYKALYDKPDGLMNFWLNQIMADDNRDISQIIECIKSVDSVKGAFDNFSIGTVYMLRGEL